jgi:hypothetical protein
LVGIVTHGFLQVQPMKGQVLINVLIRLVQP